MHCDGIACPTHCVCLTLQVSGFRADTVAARPGWSQIAAVRDRQLFEIKSPDILQPGPAALTDGLRQLHAVVHGWRSRHAAQSVT